MNRTFLVPALALVFAACTSSPPEPAPAHVEPSEASTPSQAEPSPLGLRGEVADMARAAAGGAEAAAPAAPLPDNDMAVRVIVPPAHPLADEGQALVGTWEADIELDIAVARPDGNVVQTQPVEEGSQVFLTFLADGTMRMIARFLGEEQEAYGRWDFVSAQDDVVTIRQVPFVNGATEEVVEITFVEEDIFEVERDGARLTFYRRTS